MAKFIDEIIVDDWEVETDTGWESISGIGKTIEYEEWIVDLGGTELICADTHILFNEDMQEIYAMNLNIGDKVQTKLGLKPVLNLCKNGKSSNMYDLQLQEGNHRYYTNGILSHNSVFLWNMAYLFWYYGANIAGASLEMSGNKIAKRIGARMFGVDIGQYGKFASDETAFNSALSKFKMNMNEDNIMQTAPGDLRIRRFSKATVADLRVYVDRIEQKTGQKLNGLVLDYATELSNASGLTGEKMYSYHKENCNDLYELAVASNIFVLTAHQLHVKYKGLDDVTLQMISESSAIAQRPDMIYGSIHSDHMKQENKFEMKLLKGRDTGGVGDKTSFEIDWKHMNLTAKNDIIDQAIIH